MENENREVNMLPAPIKPAITLQDLNKIDIRVGRIERVVEVADSEKLVELFVNFGDHHRCILAGIKKERPNPKELEGRQALFVVNLPPRKMAGLVSEGMLLDIGYGDGLESPALAIPDRRVTNGTRAE